MLARHDVLARSCMMFLHDLTSILHLFNFYVLFGLQEKIHELELALWLNCTWLIRWYTLQLTHQSLTFLQESSRNFAKHFRLWIQSTCWDCPSMEFSALHLDQHFLSFHSWTSWNISYNIAQNISKNWWSQDHQFIRSLHSNYRTWWKRIE